MRSEKDRCSSGLWLVLGMLSFACASVDPVPDYEQARAEIRAATAAETLYDPQEPVLTCEELDAMLSDGLGLEEAAQLALLNNRRLQAGFMALGVARSDYVQAGLLQNPSLSLAFLFPDTGGRVRWMADLAGDLSELWQIPARREVAQAGLERRILELSRFAGELVLETKTTYFASVAAREARSIAATNVDLARRSLDAVRRQVEEGAATKADENLAQSLALSAELSFRSAEREEVTRVRKLAALLSLERDLLQIALTDPIPDATWPELERESLVERSLTTRLDLRAAARAFAAAEEQVALERRRRFPDVAAGIFAERPESGSSTDFLIGPSLALEIPLFDQNQAQVSRAEFRLAELGKEYEALVAEARQEVRAAADAARVAAETAAFVHGELIPQAEQSAALAERAYELGDATVLTLLEARRAALQARRTGIEARLEAARSRLELERVLGHPLDAPASADSRP